MPGVENCETAVTMERSAGGVYCGNELRNAQPPTVPMTGRSIDGKLSSVRPDASTM